MNRSYVVLAGKQEDYQGESVENIKYCNDFDSLEDAEKCIQENQLNTYPICKVEIHYS
ncbi:TPA: hypothetical protein ACKREA_003654 [Proteus mirabilis]